MERKWAFDGVKITDFSLHGVGPQITKYLAHNGASVIRIESRLNPGICRLGGPFKDAISEPDRSLFYTNYNTGKYCIALNLDLPKAREIAWKLIEWADIMGEAFSPGVMKKWGFDYESVSRTKPDIVYFSTCQLGQYGPHAGFKGYGPHAKALAGYNHMTGWSDREPGAVWGAYTDYVSPRFGAAVLIAALDYRRRTGKGQHIDVAQFECGLQFLAPVIMDYLVNGRIQTRDGNHVPDAAPHASYQCQGSDRWVAIAVTDDEEWKAFSKVIGEPDWTKEPKFLTLIGRKENEDELNRLVGEWTINHSAEEVMAWMQEAGVLAGVLENCQDLVQDPQMMHRGHFVTMDHAVIGPHLHDGPPFKLSKTPSELRWGAPVYGEHLEYVCKDILGMSDDEIGDCVVEGVFE